MKSSLILCLSLLLCNSTLLFSQTIKISGVIQNKDKEALNATTVSLFGNTNSKAKANQKGHFSFEKLSIGNYTLVFTATNYQTQSVTLENINSDTTLHIILEERTDMLSQVEVEGSKNKFLGKDLSNTLRVQTPILELPQNVQIITKEVIKQQQIFNIMEGLSRNVSGVSRTTHWENYANLNMRGAQISAFRDGMNVSMPWGPLAEDMSIVESAEFIKGPAGFLLASGDAAGSYNIVTKKPTGQQENTASVSIGSFKTIRGAIDLDGRFKPEGKLWYRLNVSGQRNDSYRKYDHGSRLTIAPSLSYQFNDATQLTAQYLFSSSNMALTGAGYLFSQKGYKNLARDFTFSPPNPPNSNIQDQSIQLNFTHQFNPNWKITAQAAFMNYRFLGTSIWLDSLKNNGDAFRNISLWDAFGTNKIAQTFLNGQIQTGRILHKITAGIDAGIKTYMADFNQGKPIDIKKPFNSYHPVYENLENNFMDNFDTKTPLKNRATWQDNQNYTAAYFQDELGFWNNRIRLTLAGRYTYLEQENSDKTWVSYQKVTPRIALSASINKHTTTYLLYDQAFSAQFGKLFNNGNPSNVKPLLGENIELGIKKNWADDKWNTTLAIYQIKRNNETTPDVLHSTASIAYLLQLGQTQTRGIELDIKGQIAPNLNLIVNYAYTLSTVTKDIDASKIGNLAPGFAKHISNMWLSYKFDKSLLKDFGIAAGYQFQAQRVPFGVFSLKMPEIERLENYFRVDASIFYEHKKWNANLTINNLLNNYLIDGGPAVYNGIKYYYQAEAPTNARLTVGYRF